MSNAKEYFIKDTVINAYTIAAFAEAISEATKQNLALDFDSAHRYGTTFSINIFDKPAQAQEEPTVETQAPAQEETPESPAQPEESAEEPTEQSEGESEADSNDPVNEQQDDQPSTEEESVTAKAYKGTSFTVEDIEAAKDSMVELNKLGEPVGVSARSKREMVKLLKEYIGA